MSTKKYDDEDGRHGAPGRLAALACDELIPLGELIAYELREKLDSPGLSLSWRWLAANDIQGKARAYVGLVSAGMDTSKAAQLVGFDNV